MKITKAKVTRKYNLGNYESIDYELEAELSPEDSSSEAFQIIEETLDKQVDLYKKTSKLAQERKKA